MSIGKVWKPSFSPTSRNSAGPVRRAQRVAIVRRVRRAIDPGVAHVRDRRLRPGDQIGGVSGSSSVFGSVSPPFGGDRAGHVSRRQARSVRRAVGDQELRREHLLQISDAAGITTRLGMRISSARPRLPPSTAACQDDAGRQHRGRERRRIDGRRRCIGDVRRSQAAAPGRPCYRRRRAESSLTTCESSCMPSVNWKPR